MTTRLLGFLIALGSILLIPSLATAQSLAGAVRDTSGAALPGVTVEASSPALITKVRTSVTDAAGQYRIPDLPPGSYKINFSLPGFTTVVREGVELSGGGVMSINADLSVGSLQESVTVTGESPVVDVQTSRQQQVISGEVIRALPASRGYGNYVAAIPALQATGFGGGAQPTTNFFSARGGRSNEGLIQIDGLNVGGPSNGGGVSGYMYDMSTSSEVQVAISGGLGESDRGGPAFNIIPKTGGNTFSGNAFASFAGHWGQSSNIDDELRALGFGDLPALIKNWDTSASLGGPILRDRLWFFGNARLVGTHQEVQNLFANLNAGNPNAWTWERDDSISVRNANAKQVKAVRLTWQATQKNKIGFYIDHTKNCSGGAYTVGRRPVPVSRGRLGRVRTERAAGRRDHVSRVRLDLGRAVEDHAGDVDVADLESRAPRERLLVVLDAARRHPPVRRADGFHSRHGAVHRRRDAVRRTSSTAATTRRRPATSSMRRGAAPCPTSPARTTSRWATRPATW